MNALSPPVRHQEALEREEPQPEERRHRLRLAPVVVAPRGGLEERLVDDVGGVDAPAEAGIETQRDHPAQAVAVSGSDLYWATSAGTVFTTSLPAPSQTVAVVVSTPTAPGSPRRSCSP